MAKDKARFRFTQEAIDRLGKPSDGRIDYRDTHLPGFRLRVTNKGKKTYSVVTRIRGGDQIRVTLGEHPDDKDAAKGRLKEMRDKARDTISMAEAGKDPRKKELSDPENAYTVQRAADLFVKRYLQERGNRTWKETEAIFRRHVTPKWGARPMDDITRKDVALLLDGIMDSGAPIAANRTLSAVRKLFRWSLNRGMIEADPVSGMNPPATERSRDRVLDEDEIRALWKAWGAMPDPWGAYQKMLLTMLQRRNEVATMRWADIGKQIIRSGTGEEEISVWTIPAENFKTNVEQIVPLSPLAVEILDGMTNRGEYIFSTRVNAGQPIGGFSKAKKATDEKSGVEGWRYHDLRRTGATGMGNLGIADFTISRVLGHTRQDVTGRYDRAQYIPEKYRALTAWAGEIERITENKKIGQPSNVVALAAEPRP